VAEVIDVMVRFKDWFTVLEQDREPTAAPLTAALVLFPDVSTRDAPEVIDTAQRELKPGFVSAGLMVGQFHPAPPNEPGLWNPDFRPLRSPLPLLAIRRMVANDVPFLLSEPEYASAYRDRFGRDRVPQAHRDRFDQVLGSASKAAS